MLVDPMPADRIELIKCEIKQEIQVDIRNMSPMRRRGSEPPSNEDLQELSVEEVAGELGQEITKLKELMSKKIEKLDEKVQERQQVMEAKLKKTIKDAGDKSSKGLKKSEDAISKLSTTVKSEMTNLEQIKAQIKRL